MRAASLAFAILAVAACTQLAEGPSLAGFPGLQWQIQSFYGARALEENAMCTQPRMTAITGHQIVEETPERIVMRIRYHYIDEGQRNFRDNGFGNANLFFGTGSCNNFAERTFVIARGKGGAADDGRPQLFVQSMTGPQRELPPGSALQ